LKGSVYGLLVMAVAAGTGLALQRAWHTDTKSVGTGGAVVSVPEMATGGSGSSHVLGGVKVGTETIRARFVVNAAGSGSDKISRMVGDDSFTIKPRLGTTFCYTKMRDTRLGPLCFPFLASTAREFWFKRRCGGT